MGTTQSSLSAQTNTNASGTSLAAPNNRQSPGSLFGGVFKTPSSSSMGVTQRRLKEHKRHGFVVVKIHSVNSSRRNSDAHINHVITPKGAILFGSLFNPAVIQNAIAQSGFPILTPGELPIMDSRAHKLFVTYCQGWHIVPFPEIFSRHSGTCYIVGDRSAPGTPYQIKIGDCFRLGSVGLVVSELKVEGEEEQRIDAKTLQFLKDEALAFDTNEDLAALASDEMAKDTKKGREEIEEEDEDEREGDEDMTRCERETTVDNESVLGSPSVHNTAKNEEDSILLNGGLTNGEKYICYMCYETHNTAEDPLIAPCDCRGDTRFLHVQCLQRWYHSSSHGSHTQVIRTTGNGAPACKICGTAYKTNFRRFDGKRASILEMDNDGPYISLVVVTHHDTNPGLFNTKFRLNFGRRRDSPAAATDADLNTIVIGRSSSCSMVLDYRTVSTHHAKINFADGKFFLSDNRSSNGTMVYIRDPLPLPFAKSMRIRMGRTTLSLCAKRSWTAAMRSYLFFNGGGNAKEGDLDDNSPIAAATGSRTPTVSVDGNGGAEFLPQGDALSPLDLQYFLSNLHMVPSEKTELLSDGDALQLLREEMEHDGEALTNLAETETGTASRLGASSLSPHRAVSPHGNDGERDEEEHFPVSSHQRTTQPSNTNYLPPQHTHTQSQSQHRNMWNLRGSQGALQGSAAHHRGSSEERERGDNEEERHHARIQDDADAALALALMAEQEEEQELLLQQQRLENYSFGMTSAAQFLPLHQVASSAGSRSRSPRDSRAVGAGSGTMMVQSFRDETLRVSTSDKGNNERVSTPTPGHFTPPPLVAQNSSSIVVMSNMEENHLLSPSSPADNANSKTDAVLQETMMNSLPVAGVFAIPAHERERFEKKSSSSLHGSQSPCTPSILSANNSTVFGRAPHNNSNGSLAAMAMANASRSGSNECNDLTDLNEDHAVEAPRSRSNKSDKK